MKRNEPSDCENVNAIIPRMPAGCTMRWSCWHVMASHTHTKGRLPNCPVATHSRLGWIARHLMSSSCPWKNRC